MGRHSAAIQATTRITSKQMFKMFKKKHPDTKIEYNAFKKIIGDCHKLIVKKCLEGGSYSFGSLVGVLNIGKYDKKPYIGEDGNVHGLSPDFNATKKHKAQGGTQVIYHTTTLMCKWMWRKMNKGRLKNKSKWSFVPTDGPKGITRQLHKHISDNPRCTNNYSSCNVTHKQTSNE